MITRYVVATKIVRANNGYVIEVLLKIIHPVEYNGNVTTQIDEITEVYIAHSVEQLGDFIMNLFLGTTPVQGANND